MKKVAILQSNYIPWKGYFDIINSVDTFIIYDEVQYTKNDWRNRNQINTKNGLQWLTIPVRVQSLDQKIFETKVSFPKWNKKHWNSIIANYGKAPNFKGFKDRFESLYLDCKTDFLSEINLSFIKSINEILGIDTEIIDSRELELVGDKNERLIEAIKKVGGKIYLSGPSAKSYLNESLFVQEDISVEWKKYIGYPEYPSVHNNFQHGVSILDMIFNNVELSKGLFTI
ncbi:MAG: hypothetical protein CMP61_09425 [Flavobacteriales bacterium]|nr:hypothetical protein [Flavobacteriales bacterium]|tara:strand:- start:1298 stop:1981 length:684 start_codon:yes stop_codon:yes gene_type:complete